MGQLSQLVLLIPFLPLLGFAINGFTALQKARGKGFVSTTTIGIVGCAFPWLSFMLSLLAFYLVWQTRTALVFPHLLDWMVLQNFSLSFGFTIDELTAIMLMIVTGVGTLIHIYSIGYMKEDEGFAKYMAYLNLFLFFMLILVMADSLALLFVGWEGVGLCSYLLIGFWFTDSDKAKAGKKAFIVNRVGDFAFLIGMFAIVATLSEAFADGRDASVLSFLHFDTLKANAELLAPVAGFITMALFIGATGKSAQIPLYVWLPDAMAGPTPVSALIHAATMVTAGIYMIVRLHFLFVLAPATLHVIAIVGVSTALFAGIIGLTQYDIKKVLAYSTVSQLGFMFLALGAGAFSTAIFHVMTHAFFKACLFLAAGSVIHALHHEQDIRFMGGLLKKMPKTGISFLICTLAISGIPPLSGFFSKDEILYMAYANEVTRPYYWLGLLAAGITSFYMMRLFVYAFLGETRYNHPDHIHESPWVMTFPLLKLSALAVVAGLVGIPGYHLLNDYWLQDLGVEIPHHIDGSALQEMHLMIISIVWAVFCSGLAFILYRKDLNVMTSLKRRLQPVYLLVYNKFRIDELYESLFIKPIKAISDFVLFRFIDGKIIDGLLVNGSAHSVRFFSKALSVMQSGFISHYLFYLLVGLIVIMLYFTM